MLNDLAGWYGNHVGGEEGEQIARQSENVADVAITLAFILLPTNTGNAALSWNPKRLTLNLANGVKADASAIAAFSKAGYELTKQGAANARSQFARLRRLIYDNREFPVISLEYWAAHGPANGRSLHHWLFPQRARWVPRGIRNSGLNLLELPPMRGVFHNSLGLNEWMGFARNWGTRHALRAAAVENAIRIAIPTLGAGTAYVSYQVGDEVAVIVFKLDREE